MSAPADHAGSTPTTPSPATASPASSLPPPPAAASAVFGHRLGLAQQYASLLAGDAVTRGLVGPREVPRLWERHLLNCAVVADLLPAGARVVDVGSGAGLPGLVLAVLRPDLRVDLVEPMQRRTTFLDEAVRTLRLGDTVRVVRGRADDAQVRRTAGSASWVTARAVAPLDRLAAWCLPLLAPGGRLLAMKGQTAEAEAEAYRAGPGSGLTTEVVELEVTGVEPVRVVMVTVPLSKRTRKVSR